MSLLGKISRSLKIETRDNVATALVEIHPGDRIEVEGQSDNEINLIAKDIIPFGHKVCLEVITEGGEVIKYGASIGVATSDITEGEHVHVHNVTSARARRDDRDV